MTPKYIDLIDMGFEREDFHDTACFNETGYNGFVLTRNFPNLNLLIQTGCIAQNESAEWDFMVSTIDDGVIIVSHIPFEQIKKLVNNYSSVELAMQNNLDVIYQDLSELQKINADIPERVPYITFSTSEIKEE